MPNNPSLFLQKRPLHQHDIRWDHSGWFIMRELRRSLKDHISELDLPTHAKVLDFGCATQPYRGLFLSSNEYLGADLPGNTSAQVHINIDGTLPVSDSSFDLVLSTQVLEHIPDPAAYVRECFRVLRPGGRLILTTHGLWIYHRDPVDYWRWTADGLRFLAEGIGFKISGLEGLMGLSAVAVQLFQDATYRHLPHPLRRFYGFFMQRLIALFDRMHSPQSRVKNAMVYVMVAERPKSNNHPSNTKNASD